MADDIQHNPISGIVNPRKKAPGTVSWRPSYNPDNAKQFQPLFDEMMVKMNGKFISSAESGYKVNTLYIKANDALKWLIDNHADSEKYATLRCRIRISRTVDGIMLQYKQQIADFISKASKDSQPIAWKGEFSKWLEDSKEFDIFEREGIIVTEQDKAWLIDVMAQLKSDSSEVQVTSTSVKVMR